MLYKITIYFAIIKQKGGEQLMGHYIAEECAIHATKQIIVSNPYILNVQKKFICDLIDMCSLIKKINYLFY